MTPPNLFLVRLPGGGQCYELDVDGRTRKVKTCEDPALLHAALDYPDLQKSVRTAIQRRLCQLESSNAT